MVRWIFPILVASAVAVFAALAVLLATEKRETPAAPPYRVAHVGGLEYEAMLARPIHPANEVDNGIVAGLPDGERRTAGSEILFGAFISVTNTSPGALPTARRIDLRDEGGDVYHPLPLPAGNAYAYTPRLIHPRTRIPAFGSEADDNLAATGRLLLYRIPARQYDDGILELVIDDPADPADPARTASLTVSG